MAIDIGLKVNLKLAPHLTVTPKLQLAIKLLQMSRLELSDLVKEEANNNPTLEVEEAEKPEPTQQNGFSFEKEAINYLFEGEGFSSIRQFTSASGKTYKDIEEHISLLDHILFQINLLPFDQTERNIARFLAGNLDKSGYLQISLKETALHTKTSIDFVSRIHEKLQLIDPVGLFAKSLQECLLWQLKDRGLKDSLAFVVISEYLTMLENKDYSRIAKALGINIDEVIKAIDIIKKLDPSPALKFDYKPVKVIVPDVIIAKVGNSFVVTLNRSSMPRVKINKYYSQLIQNPDALSKETQHYIRNNINSALWLIKSIHQREIMLYKVSEAIVKFQRNFMEHGTTHLKPLTLRSVALYLNVHESTISRTTMSKYVQTPQGLFKLKFFFAGGIFSETGSLVSTKVIEEWVRNVLVEENSKNPLTDEKIVNKLYVNWGVNLARRTVAKYRKKLGYPSSSCRKKNKFNT